MKFKVNSKELRLRLENLQKVRKSGRTIIPILDYFKIEVTDDKVLMTSSDKEMTLTAKLVPEEIKETGVTCVLADQLVEIVRKVGESTAEIYTEGTKLVLKVKGGKFKIPCVDAEDFPIMMFGEPDGEVGIPSVIFVEAINKTIFCARKIEMEPIWDNISIHTSDDGIEFAASDKQSKLAVYRSAYDIGNNTEMIIPSKLASIMPAITTKNDIYISLAHDEKRIMVDLIDYTVYCIKCDGTYPKYKPLLDYPIDCSFVVVKSDLKDSIERSLVFANTQQIVAIQTLTGSVSVSAENRDFSLESEEEIIAENKEGTGYVIVNGRFLIDILNNVSSQKVELSFSETSPSVYINPVDTEEDYIYSLWRYKKLTE